MSTIPLPSASSPTTTIGDLAKSRDNNFNLLRFLAASAVLLSHCWPLTLGSNATEPLARIFSGLTLGTSSVLVFFAISGFLVASSWERNPSAWAFLVARVLRIYPGLTTMLVLSVLVLGPLMTKLPIGDYLGRIDTWTYVPSNMLLAKGQLTLPGVLERAPYGVLNGSLWTLAYEFACYLALLTSGMAGGLTRKTFVRTLLFFVAVGLLLSLTSGAETKGFANKVILLGPAFLIGAGIWIWRASIPASGLLASVLAAVGAASMLGHLPMAHLLLSLAVAYGSLYVALVPRGAIRNFNKTGDCSYGMYIYAFPMQQAMHYTFPQLNVWGLFISAFAVTLPLAAASWVFVEKPALAWGKAYLVTRRRAALESSPT
jgi:peptidoglycan/LPS O-acetylase OafA/YrhL